MEKEFVSFELALQLKQLGFDEPCFGKFYFNHLEIGGNWSNDDFKEDPDIFISAPLYQQAFRFFREKYDLFGCIDLHVSTPLHWYVRIDEISINDYVYHSEDDSKYYENYEDAELACLMKLIEIVENM